MTDDDLEDPHEAWVTIDEFPGYSVSDKGRIRNDTTGRVLSLTKNQHGLLKVGLSKDGHQYVRSVALLVVQYHLPKPPEHIYDTPIHLDGDLTNCRLENLMWRPRWFAIKYQRQFKEEARQGYRVAIQALGTGEIYPNSMAAAMRYGILAEDTVKSAMMHMYVFPTFQKFKVIGEVPDDE